MHKHDLLGERKIFEEELEDFDDLDPYSELAREKMVDDDVLSGAEEGIIKGFEEAA